MRNSDQNKIWENIYDTSAGYMKPDISYVELPSGFPPARGLTWGYFIQGSLIIMLLLFCGLLKTGN
jgi:hypothetical protein